MLSSKVASMNLHYSIYGNPYRAFAKGVLMTCKDAGAHIIRVPIEIGRVGCVPDDLFVDAWLGIRQNICFVDYDTVVLSTRQRDYHFYHRSQSQHTEGQQWLSGPLANKFYGDLVVVASDKRNQLVDIQHNELSTVKNLISLLHARKKPFIFATLPDPVVWWPIAGFFDKFGSLTNDHVYEMLTCASFESLVSYAKLSASFRRAAQQEIRLRISYFLEPFIAPGLQGVFLDTVANSNAAIVGTLPTAVLTSIRSEYPSIFNMMTIVVAKGKLRGIVQFLRNLHAHDQMQAQWTTVSVESSTNPKCPFLVHERLTNGLKFIDVYECRWVNILNGILSMPNTGYMNILTVNELISFYPNLTADKKTCINPWALMDGFVNIVGNLEGSLTYTPGAITSELGRPCGKECAMLWRKTAGLDGIGIFNWQGFMNHRKTSYSLSDYIDQSNIKWRIGLKCANSYCATCGLRTERL
ncbi:hypothetical protein C8J56DRAFT_1051860 [Mycena floridula]|nr:hypothetical protein C8J56DRAFT_1051860 [Mycena floridula]